MGVGRRGIVVSFAQWPTSRALVVGGAGFIGSHVVDRLLARAETERVTIYDNFSSGRRWHFEHHLDDARLSVVESDVGDLDALTSVACDHDLVVHLASNPDIAAAMVDPTIDFYQGTVLTHNVVEAMRRAGVARILYASGSGVYGDLGEAAPTEDHGPLEPTSTYGASKVAGEALLSAYAHMFGLCATAFRFGNVVGPRQTHGVGFDFLKGLRKDPTRLRILGDGSQSKSYIHVADVLDAVFHLSAGQSAPFEAFNVATGDYVTVTEIAELVVEVLELDRGAVQFIYTGGDRGWKGDVPVVRLDTSKASQHGWQCSRGAREALRQSLLAMLPDEWRLGW
jgi:UDP-glucose 4-epimerase